MRYLLCILLVAGGLVSGVLVTSLHAQRAPGSIGVGTQAGQPGGFTVKTYGRAPWAGVFSLGTNFRDQTVAHVHLLRERDLPESALWVFWGPSLFLGLRSLDTRSRVVAGAGARVGLNFYTERIEVYLHASPRAEGLPAPDIRIGGSVGLRYYLRF
jgi:hypothetical protein